MRPTKIVLIGAASASFGPKMIADAVLTPEVRGSTLALVDLDRKRLGVMTAYANRLNEAAGAGLDITSHTNREMALPDAEFVITAVAVKRDTLWKRDFAIPKKYGIKQVLGENGGPGGLSHALRNIPIILDIASDMEIFCPDATLLNFTNPESRVCLALSRYSEITSIGLCHGIGMGYDAISRITGVPAADIIGTAAGLNHFSWFLNLRRRSTGEDIYPLIEERDATYDQSYMPLSRYLMRQYGLYPHCSDDHIGEYLGFAHEFCGLKGYDFARADRRRAENWSRILRVVSGEEVTPLPATGTPDESDLPVLRPSGEFAFPIIAAHIAGRHDFIEAVNIPNDGLISNLPDWAVVEVPAVASADGVHGVAVGPLPNGAAALLNTQAHIQSLVVDAAVMGSRDLALQALLADPVVTSADAAEKTLDELLSVHAQYLGNFEQTEWE